MFEKKATPESLTNLEMSEERESPGKPSQGTKTIFATVRKVNWGAYGVITATIIIWLLFNFATKGLFLSPRNLTMMLIQGVVLGIVVNGVLLVMVTGNIDISIASTVGLSATVAAWLQAQHGWPMFPTIIVVTLVGLAIGIAQGTWIAYVGIPAFIVTLAGQTIFRGAALLLNHGQTYSPMSQSFKVIAGGTTSPTMTMILIGAATLAVILPPVLNILKKGGSIQSSLFELIKRVLPILVVLGIVAYISLSYKGIPFPVLILTVLALVVHFIAARTRFGRHLYAIGGNREAAVMAGINVKLHVLLVFAGMGILYAFSGIVLASRLNGAPPDPALFLEMDAITACVIGGTSMFGGIGTIPGAMLGTLLLIGLNNGMDLMGINTFIQFIVKGIVLLLAVLLDISLKKRRA